MSLQTMQLCIALWCSQEQFQPAKPCEIVMVKAELFAHRFWRGLISREEWERGAGGNGFFLCTCGSGGKVRRIITRMSFKWINPPRAPNPLFRPEPVHSGSVSLNGCRLGKEEENTKLHCHLRNDSVRIGNRMSHF